MTDQLDTAAMRKKAGEIKRLIGGHKGSSRDGTILTKSIQINLDLCDTILALCDALDEANAVRMEQARLLSERELALRAEIERQHVDYAELLGHNTGLTCKLIDSECENERLRSFITNFSETKFDRIDRRMPDPQDDLDPLTDYLAIEAWQEDARAALAQKANKDD